KRIAAVSKRHKGGAAWWSAQSKRCRERDDLRCQRCGADWRLGAAHVVPLGSRGTRNDAALDLNELRNLVTLCSRCNVAHDQELAFEWADIGVTPCPDLVAKYGYRERRTDRRETA
ncbi:MAG TPA: HNH endonuclease, partial [Phycisphaerae bacterium]|nr:HNH endonuclease [Phycisphaerae bacterium]